MAILLNLRYDMETSLFEQGHRGRPPRLPAPGSIQKVLEHTSE
jgi:hypothetical protein